MFKTLPLFFLLVANTVWAASPYSGPTCGSLDNIATAVHLTELLYPEFRRQPLAIVLSGAIQGASSCISATNRTCGDKVTEKATQEPTAGPVQGRHIGINVSYPATPTSRSAHQGDKTMPGLENDIPVYLSFDFYDDFAKSISCRPNVVVNGVGTSKLDQAAVEFANSHPEWSSVEVTKAMNERWPMKLGPTQRVKLISSLPLSKLARFYGQMQVTKAAFGGWIVKDSSDKVYNSADFRWYVMAKEVGTTRELQLMIEPFEGRIVGITEFDQRSMRVNER